MSDASFVANFTAQTSLLIVKGFDRKKNRALTVFWGSIFMVLERVSRQATPSILQEWPGDGCVSVRGICRTCTYMRVAGT